MDVVNIRIVAAPDLSATARVEPDGTIAFPYVGRIKAAGLTEDELAERIEQELIGRKIFSQARSAPQKRTASCHAALGRVSANGPSTEEGRGSENSRRCFGSAKGTQGLALLLCKDIGLSFGQALLVKERGRLSFSPQQPQQGEFQHARQRNPGERFWMRQVVVPPSRTCPVFAHEQARNNHSGLRAKSSFPGWCGQDPHRAAPARVKYCRSGNCNNRRTSDTCLLRSVSERVSFRRLWLS